MRRSPLARGTKPLKRGKALAAGKALARKVGLAQVGQRRAAEAEAAGKPVKPALATRPSPAVPYDVRATLIERSGGGWCEIALPGCLGRGNEPSHRITVKAGGRKGAAAKLHNRPSNALWSCRRCHDWCHASPALAYEDGLMLREYQNPAMEPVLYRGELSYLTDDGRVLSYEEAGP